MSGARREGALFLGALEQFTFNFGTAASDEIQNLGAEDEDQENILTSSSITDVAEGAALPMAAAPPLAIDEVIALFEGSSALGSTFFDLPANASTLDAAIAQYAHVVQRQVAAIKSQAKQKQQKSKQQKRERE